MFVDGSEQGGEIGEGGGGDGAGGRWVFLVECSNGLVHMHVFGGYPFVRVLSVAFPSDKVLELSAEYAGVQDFVDFVFLFSLYKNGVQRWRSFRVVVMPRRKMINMEDGVNLEPVW